MGEGAEQITGGLRWTGGWTRQAQHIPMVGTPVLDGTLTPTAGPEAIVASVPPRSQESESARRGLSPRLCQALTRDFHGLIEQGMRTSPIR